MRRRIAVGLALVLVLLVAGVVVMVVRGGDSSDDEARPSTTTVPEPGDSGRSTTSSTATAPEGSPGASGVGDPYFPGLGNGGYDVDHYTLRLTWQPDDGAIEGLVTVDAKATQALSTYNLDLAGMEVSSVSVDGEAARFERADRELVITPPEVLAEGSSFSTVVAYAGVPEPVGDGTDLFDVGWQIDGREVFVVNEPAGAATFYPVNDHPTDKATYTFEITAPEDQVVAANGLLVSEQEIGHGQKAWTYEASDPMASYLVQIAIGDYELVDAGTFGDVVIRHAFHRSLAAAAKVATARTAEMIDVLDDVFGPYPFEAYGVVAVDEDLGFALETQTLTIIGSDIAHSGRGADDILLHELAHQWVGNTVSPATWQDIWLNEGFASYAEWLWSERTGGPSAAEHARSFQGAGLDTPPGDPGSRELFGRSVYWRGGMALQALREEIGEDAFFTVLRRWVDEKAGSVASTDDLIALAEEVSSQPLDALFDTWIYQPEAPLLP